MMCLMVARTLVLGFILMNIYLGRFIVVRYEVDCQIRARRVCQPGGRKSRGNPGGTAAREIRHRAH